MRRVCPCGKKNVSENKRERARKTPYAEEDKVGNGVDFEGFRNVGKRFSLDL